MTTLPLTIAIPTFERNTELTHLLERLLPQLTDEVHLVIQDNCSRTPVAEAIQPLLSHFPHAKIHLIRNKVNVGANANILRCFELCESDWIWVVGDDDDVEPDAVSTILDRLQEYPDCLIVNFPINLTRNKVKLTTGFREFTDELDDAADIPWITSTVYKVSELLPSLRFGYQYAFSMLPHVAMLMMSFREEHRCLFASDHIASRDRAGASTEQQTPIVNMALGFGVLLDLPLDLAVRRKLIQKLLVTTDSPGLPLRQLAYQLLLLSIKTGDRKNSLYYFDQACGRRFYFDKTFGQRIEIAIYRILLMLPEKLIARGYRLAKGKEISTQIHQDRIARL